VREQKNLLTVREAAELLGCTPGTIYAWCEADPPLIPHLKLNRSVRLDRDELIRWLDTKRVPLRGER
jgi:excisionase family DNA binding protein